MFYKTRSKLSASFLAVSIIAGSISLLIGILLLYNAVVNEATNRISLDLNAAREMYQAQIESIRCPLSIVSMEPSFYSALKRRDVAELTFRLESVAKITELDFIGVVTKEGNTLCRIGKSSIHSKNAKAANPIAEMALDRMVPVAGTVILGREFLSAESPELADRARIKFIPTPRAAPRTEKEETSGMALAAGIPVYRNGLLFGILYGGILLSRNKEIVDKVRDTVFQNEIYKDRSIGTATIFFDDLRISTNVLTRDGKRAIGTRVSKEVKKYVLTDGKKWTDRAFVVSDWYITAYEPIEDIFGKRVGMLYVGVLEAKYADIRRNALLVLIVITMAGMALSIGLGIILKNRIMRPVYQLIEASAQVSQGNFSPDIGHTPNSEIGILQKTFIEMLNSLQKRDRRQRAESEIQLLQSEKQASIGRLAAGVAHEINNPLTGVLTFSHMLLRRKDLSDEVQEDLRKITRATERVRTIVKGLLDFSRQTKLDREPTDLNKLISSAISLVKNEALVGGVALNFKPGEGLPEITLDQSQIQSVLLNIIINALDATDPGGVIDISTGIGLVAQMGEQKAVEIVISDTGCGIPPDVMDKLFDPFFTTKEVGEGTGLGLSVSYGIIERHGGAIVIRSEVGKGSAFTIWLPLDRRNSETIKKGDEQDNEQD